MTVLVLLLFRFIRLLGSGHEALAVENAALRFQLLAYQRKRMRPKLTTFDRLFWCTLSRLWRGWRTALLVVQPDTVVRWQRERFRKFWARLSKHKVTVRGRPAVAPEIRRLIIKMATANPLWRAPRIHGELKMLGIKVSERTVSRILRSIPRPPSQSWKTFLRNHADQIVAVDFFTVPTFTFKILFVFILIAHRRREVLHFNITEHPTAEWISQQILEAFADRDVAKYLIRDRDGVYGGAVGERLAALNIQQVLTAPASPWQHAYVERLIGTIRRECLNHVIIFNRYHLKRILTSYFSYYTRSRTHLALAKDCPQPRPAQTDGKITRIPQVGGLHSRYVRDAA
jgi:putative transposase